MTLLDSLLLLAQIDRQRDDIRSAEEETATLVGKIDHGQGSEETLRRIGEMERKTSDLKLPLTKAVSRLRTQAPDLFNEWVDRNRQALQRIILKDLIQERPDVKTFEEGLARITQEGKFSKSDLAVLQLSGFLDEWAQLIAKKCPFVLNPPSWEAWPNSPPATIELRNPLPLPTDLANRHADILSLTDWKPWHQGLIFFAETLGILDQGKPCLISRETSPKSASGEWQSNWTLSTGSLSISARWGERVIEGQTQPAAFSASEVKGLLPGEKLTWDGSLGSESAGLVTHWSGLREDRRRAIEALAGLLFTDVRQSSASPG